MRQSPCRWRRQGRNLALRLVPLLVVALGLGCRSTVSMGWERGVTVAYASSREFEFKAGHHYRFRLRKKVEGMMGNLIIKSVSPEPKR
ncbi:MAG: hypothetical protein IT581_23070 [Verrucomicrobiales bacterium]|nr:hypothetical protein [Verrucomicrobiales bacterium]